MKTILKMGGLALFALTFSAAVNAQSSLTPCETLANLMQSIAVDRDKGVPITQELDAVKAETASKSAVEAMFIEHTKDVYARADVSPALVYSNTLSSCRATNPGK